MKVLQINIFGNLSTGRIAVDLYHVLRDNGHEGMVAFARNQIDEDVPHFQFGSKRSVYADGIMSRITDKAGFYSKKPTQQLIQKIEEYDPDIIHLHNLHGYYINIEILFDYLRRCGKPVVWTLHDCWAFTGHCCYYSMAKCSKWKTGCAHCPQKGAYPKSILRDNSEWNYRKKRELFTSLPGLQLVCVSNWLRHEVEQSFLKELPCEVIYNGIDLNVFKPTGSDFRKRYGLENKKIILGVASTWDARKGLDDFIRLSGMLDAEHQIVLVGLNEKQLRKIPSNILGIRRTNSIQELAEIYTAADVFLNASVEETFGLPTVEAMACGTPVIVYNATAVPEVVTEKSGFVVESHDIDTIVQRIPECENLNQQDIIQNACLYSKDRMLERYLQIYNISTDS